MTEHTSVRSRDARGGNSELIFGIAAIALCVLAVGGIAGYPRAKAGWYAHKFRSVDKSACREHLRNLIALGPVADSFLDELIVARHELSYEEGWDRQGVRARFFKRVRNTRSHRVCVVLMPDAADGEFSLASTKRLWYSAMEDVVTGAHILDPGEVMPVEVHPRE